MNSKSVDKEELQTSFFKAVHVASGARLLTAVPEQERVCKDVHLARGSRLLTAVPLQRIVCNVVHAARGARLLTAVKLQFRVCRLMHAASGVRSAMSLHPSISTLVSRGSRMISWDVKMRPRSRCCQCRLIAVIAESTMSLS